MTAEGWQLNDVVVFTGGEPTLQHYLLDVIVALRSRNRHATVQLETNGTQASFFVKANTPEYRDHCHMSVVCSPKAGPKGYVELSPTVLVEVEALKFVVSADEGPHHEIPEWALDIRRGARNVLCDVYVSPMAQYLRAYDGEVSSIWDDTLIDKPRTSANYSYAAAYALKHNLRLSLQGHLFCALP
jgi:organic radical activating enzyme